MSSLTLRDLPAVDSLADLTDVVQHFPNIPRALRVVIARQAVDEVRSRIQAGESLDANGIAKVFHHRLRDLDRSRLQPVINGTGILIHTNLGRAPLPADVWQRLADVMTGYCNLEIDIADGRRGQRGGYVEQLLAVVTGAEAATVVNNCAAALHVSLNSLALRKEVIISRGELVQIGGGFRIPDILRRAGSRLVEVGTTNITTLDDYREVIGDRTGLILKVHRSNFVQGGFTSEVTLTDLVGLGNEYNVPVVNDLGSGVLVPTTDRLGYTEPTVQQSVAVGAALTLFSGDKLLGGSQSGLVVGAAETVMRLKKNPLFRTVRADKVIFALLQEILPSYLEGNADHDIPIWRQLAVPESKLYSRLQSILAELNHPEGLTVEGTSARIGGGASPEVDIPSLAIRFAPERFNPTRVAEAFRHGDVSLVGRILDDAFVIDFKAIPEHLDATVVAATKALLTAPEFAS